MLTTNPVPMNSAGSLEVPLLGTCSYVGKLLGYFRSHRGQPSPDVALRWFQPSMDISEVPTPILAVVEALQQLERSYFELRKASVSRYVKDETGLGPARRVVVENFVWFLRVYASLFTQPHTDYSAQYVDLYKVAREVGLPPSDDYQAFTLSVQLTQLLERDVLGRKLNEGVPGAIVTVDCRAGRDPLESVAGYFTCSVYVRAPHEDESKLLIRVEREMSAMGNSLFGQFAAFASIAEEIQTFLGVTPSQRLPALGAYPTTWDEM